MGDLWLPPGDSIGHSLLSTSEAEHSLGELDAAREVAEGRGDYETVERLDQEAFLARARLQFSEEELLSDDEPSKLRVLIDPSVLLHRRAAERLADEVLSWRQELYAQFYAPLSFVAALREGNWSPMRYFARDAVPAPWLLSALAGAGVRTYLPPPWLLREFPLVYGALRARTPTDPRAALTLTEEWYFLTHHSLLVSRMKKGVVAMASPGTRTGVVELHGSLSDRVAKARTQELGRARPGLAVLEMLRRTKPVAKYLALGGNFVGLGVGQLADPALGDPLSTGLDAFEHVLELLDP